MIDGAPHSRDDSQQTRTPNPSLYCGSAAEMLRAHVATGAVQMVYADPPFGNDRVWSGPAGSFSDRWRQSPDSEAGWAALHAHSPAGAALVDLAAGPGRSARPYLGVMAGILLEVRRVLSPLGTLWLHFDDTMGAQLKLLCDAVFGFAPGTFLGEVNWRRTSAHGNRSRQFSRVHDTIAVYARSRAARWRLWRCGSGLVHGDPAHGRVVVNGLLEHRLASGARERLGYPTQKPAALLEQLVRAATLPGDTVLDPTCGSGTTLAAALRLGRRAIGIDVSPDAIATTTRRLFANASREARA